ncbi:MAG: MCE family protein [Solirubrobacterales bacterium]|nr:MCE family protein [Solirubrobacterales bacterium]
MKRAIKTHFKDFLAIAGLIVIAIAVLLFILSNQKAALPSWIPGLGQEFYSINVEMETAQAVTPGQGQAAVIAGINVGKVGASTLDDGIAKVRLDIEPEYKELIHEDAQFLLRPKTGLSDMVVEIDPGTKGPTPPEGTTFPVAQSMSNVQMDQILASLDRDTQDYLVLLLNGAGEGLHNKGPELSQALRRFGPFATYTARLNGELEKRRKFIARGVHSFSEVASELGDNGEIVADFISASKENLGNYAAQEAALREALREFPSTLEAGRINLTKSDQLSQLTRPTLLGLIPGARNLRDSLRSVQRLATDTTPLVRDNIRPFTRQVQPVFKELGRTSRAGEKTTPQLRGAFTHINTLLNTLAYNPSGDSEGFLFYAPWANHNFNASVAFQDGLGLVRRSVNMLSCATGNAANAVVDQNVQLETAYRLNQLPPPEAVCP